MRQFMLRVFQTIALLFCGFSSAYAQNALEVIDGNWYSKQWKYGYVLKNGIGTATSTNSPNFQVGQQILQLTATSHTTFSGRQVYTDGKFYLVTATLHADGRLHFEGEKNAKWFMERVGASSQASAVIDTNFKLVNSSAEPIFEFYISPLKSTGWGKDILGDDVLMPGYEQPFTAGNSNGCQFDLKVVYRNKRIEEKRNLNLCQLDRVDFDGRSSTAPTAQNNPAPASAPRPAPAAPRPAAYDGTTPLRCGTNVNCSNQAEVVQKMQARWAVFSRSTHYSSTCLEAVQRMRTMHPAAYGSGSPGFVQPQMDICNLR
jgi:hypothetical protein